MPHGETKTGRQDNLCTKDDHHINEVQSSHYKQ